MRKLSLIFALLLALSSLALAQGTFVGPFVSFKVVNGLVMPNAGATVTVCAASVGGIPCSPALSNAVYSNQALTQPLTNPFTADANGDYSFAIRPGNYTVTETASGFAGKSFQVSVPISGVSLPASATIIGSNSGSAPVATALPVGSTFVGNSSNLPVAQPKLVIDMRDGINGSPGVICDGTTDNTTAIQNYLNYYGAVGAYSRPSVTLQFPIGTCLTGPLVHEGLNGLGIRLLGTKGFDNVGTNLQWNGPNGGTMMMLLGENGSSVEEMTILPYSAAGTNAQNGIWWESSNSLSASVTYNLSAITRSGNVVTAATSTAHAITANPGPRIVKVAGSTGGTTSFNGTFQVLYTNDTTHLSWFQPGPNESGTASTGTVTNYKSNPSNGNVMKKLQINGSSAVHSTISSISGTNPTHVVTATPHFIYNGDTVCLRGVTDASYTGCYRGYVTSSTGADLLPLPGTYTSPSGTASSGGTLLSGSSDIRFAHVDPSTEQVSFIRGEDLILQGDWTGNCANAIESDEAGNVKDFRFDHIQAFGCRYGFNGFEEGTFDLKFYFGGLAASDTEPTLASFDFINMCGQVSIEGAEMESPNHRLFSGGCSAGNTHLDHVSFESTSPTDGIVIENTGGPMVITASEFFGSPVPLIAMGPFFTPCPSCSNASLVSEGNTYANTAIGGAWANAPFIPVVDNPGGNVAFAPGSYYGASALNITSIGDMGTQTGYPGNNSPLNNVTSMVSIAQQNAGGYNTTAPWASGAMNLLTATGCVAAWKSTANPLGDALCHDINGNLVWRGLTWGATLATITQGNFASSNTGTASLTINVGDTVTVFAATNGTDMIADNGATGANVYVQMGTNIGVGSMWVCLHALESATSISDTGGTIPVIAAGTFQNVGLVYTNPGAFATDAGAPSYTNTPSLNFQSGAANVIAVAGLTYPFRNTGFTSSGDGTVKTSAVPSVGDSDGITLITDPISTIYTNRTYSGTLAGTASYAWFMQTIELVPGVKEFVFGQAIDSPVFTTKITTPMIQTTTNCAAAGSGANPSLVACGSAASGAFSCATNASTGTCKVSTTVVLGTADEIFVQPNAGATISGVTCNATADTGLTAPRLASQTAGYFIINLGTFSADPMCFNYFVVN